MTIYHTKFSSLLQTRGSQIATLKDYSSKQYFSTSSFDKITLFQYRTWLTKKLLIASKL